MMQEASDRRSFFKRAGLLAVGSAAAAFGTPPLVQEMNGGEEDQVTPVEDLSREHGLLNRVLLIYDEFIRRLGSRQEFDPGLVADSAGIIRNFIEAYHEKLEEDHLFPRFEKAHTLTELVEVLREQHRAGRGLTSRILQLADAPALKSAADRETLAGSLAAFTRMYRPHEAREDTVLVPALRGLVSPNEYDSLGEEFEKTEHQLFGAEGFEGMLEKVGSIEKALGIYDLGQFTPR